MMLCSGWLDCWNAHDHSLYTGIILQAQVLSWTSRMPTPVGQSTANLQIDFAVLKGKVLYIR